MRQKIASTAASGATSCRRNCDGARLGWPRSRKARAPHKPSRRTRIQYNFTDPESRIMKGADGMVQGYNAQAAEEPTLLLIVGQAVTEAANDKKQLKPNGGTHRTTVRTASGSDFGRQRILFGGEPGAPEIGRGTGASDRGVHRDKQAKAWRASPTGEARSVAEGRDQGGADETETADQGGQSRLRGAQVRSGAGVRADQAGARVPSILAPRKRESERGVGAGVPDA